MSLTTLQRYVNFVTECVTWAISHRVRRLGREAQCLTPSRAEDESVRSHTSVSLAYFVACIGTTIILLFILCYGLDSFSGELIQKLNK